jgi:hypothetical protein
MTRRECAQEKITRQGPIEIGRSCTRYTTIRSGVYADPRLYDASEVAHAKHLSVAMNYSFDLLKRGPRVLEESGAIKKQFADDMKLLVSMNACNSPTLKRFQENLRRFALGEAPLR